MSVTEGIVGIGVPLIEACQDGVGVGSGTPIKTRKGVTLAVLDVMHSDDCKVSWAQVTPALGAGGAELDVTIEATSRDSEKSTTGSITTEVLYTGTLADNGGCVRASVTVTSSVGSGAARSRCLDVDGN